MRAAKLLAALDAQHQPHAKPDELPHAKRVCTSAGNESVASAPPPPPNATTSSRDEPIVISDDEGTVTPSQHPRAATTRETLRRHAESLRNTRRANARLAQHAEKLLFVDYTLMYEQAVEFVLEQHSSYFETLVPVLRHRISADARYRTRVMDGDTILANMEADLEAMPMKRSYLQKQFHRLLLNVTAPLYFKTGTIGATSRLHHVYLYACRVFTEWRDNRLAIMARYQFQDVRYSVEGVWCVLIWWQLAQRSWHFSTSAQNSSAGAHGRFETAYILSRKWSN
jgi:hypothetical protein